MTTHVPSVRRGEPGSRSEARSEDPLRLCSLGLVPHFVGGRNTRGDDSGSAEVTVGDPYDQGGEPQSSAGPRRLRPPRAASAGTRTVMYTTPLEIPMEIPMEIPQRVAYSMYILVLVTEFRRSNQSSEDT